VRRKRAPHLHSHRYIRRKTGLNLEVGNFSGKEGKAGSFLHAQAQIINRVRKGKVDIAKQLRKSLKTHIRGKFRQRREKEDRLSGEGGGRRTGCGTAHG